MKFAKVALWLLAVLTSIAVIVMTALMLPTMGGSGSGAPMEGVAIMLFLAVLAIAIAVLVGCLSRRPKNELNSSRALGSLLLYLGIGAVLWLATR